MITNFQQKVYKICKKIPKGRVSTYKEIAKALNTKAHRAIGQALAKNPFSPEIPCHRVVKSDGNIGGFMGKTKGNKIKKKIDLLKKEGIIVNNKKIVDKKIILKNI
ncbi:MGMT family protein [Nanoarchaeota archaeon]